MAIVFTQIEIAAPASEVWTALTDFAAYPAWNPIIRRIERAGSGLALTLRPPSQPGFSFEASISQEIAGRCLVWQGACVHPRFLAWHHQIEIEARPGFSILRQTARLTGWLIKPVPDLLMRPCRNGFARMNEALRDRVEDAGRCGVLDPAVHARRVVTAL